jgi:dTDP-4-amino-4,6-dideoxygalactose transaminase
MFFLVCKTGEQREYLIKILKQNGILAVFHYLSLHKSQYYKNVHGNRELPYADRYTDTLVRLPLFYELTDQ